MNSRGVNSRFLPEEIDLSHRVFALLVEVQLPGSEILLDGKRYASLVGLRMATEPESVVRQLEMVGPWGLSNTHWEKLPFPEYGFHLVRQALQPFVLGSKAEWYVCSFEKAAAVLGHVIDLLETLEERSSGDAVAVETPGGWRLVSGVSSSEVHVEALEGSIQVQYHSIEGVSVVECDESVTLHVRNRQGISPEKIARALSQVCHRTFSTEEIRRLLGAVNKEAVDASNVDSSRNALDYRGSAEETLPPIASAAASLVRQASNATTSSGKHSKRSGRKGHASQQRGGRS